MKPSTQIDILKPTKPLLNDYNPFINYYSQTIGGTGYLAYRDIPVFLGEVRNKLGLDFGCGAGRSTRILHQLGLQVIGVDIDCNMISAAKNNIPGCSFIHLNSNILPFPDNYFDVVFNSFVLFDLSSKDEIIFHSSEMKRVCKPGGKVVSIVNSNYLFTKNWLTVRNNFEENSNLKSGDVAKILLTDQNITLFDYYWTQEDFLDCFSKTGFSNIQINYPIGRQSDGFTWKDETFYPPYAVFVKTK